MTGSVVAIVPSLGRSPVLRECLEALGRQNPAPRVVLVQQGEPPLPELVPLVDEVMQEPANLGFAAANNLALHASDEPWVLAVNDDAVLADDWLAQVLAAARTEDVHSVQGANVRHADPSRLDGCGLVWNSWWQATQLFEGEPVATLASAPFEVSGVSATAALYRRRDLKRVALGQEVFDSAYGSYYEDVDLALRLATTEGRALCVPAARALHVGSATGAALGSGKAKLLVRNRILSLARASGLGLLRLLPRVLLRDVADAVRSPRLLGATLAGWCGALLRCGVPLRSGGSVRSLRAATQRGMRP